MVVADAAKPVTELSAVVGQGVDEAALGEQGECAVHGRQADPHSAVSEPLEELLSSDVVRLSLELFDHMQALPRDAKPAATQCLRCG